MMADAEVIDYWKPYHKAEVVTTPEGDRVPIDCGILDDIRTLWDSGIRTNYSCEGPGKDRYVSFPTPEDAARAVKFLSWARTVVVGTFGTGLYAKEPGWVSPGYAPDMTVEELCGKFPEKTGG